MKPGPGRSTRPPGLQCAGTGKTSDSTAATTRYSIGLLSSGAGASPPAAILESHEPSQIARFGAPAAQRNCRHPASATPARRPGQLDLDQQLAPEDEGSFNVSTFDFITGKWFSSQICSSAEGIAVDQWGWDL